jgi:transposase
MVNNPGTILTRQCAFSSELSRHKRECHRNLEVMWLLGRLAPDQKTIADFRKDNGAAIKKVCGQLVELCRTLGLLLKASVAIDGSKFKAVNNRDKNFTRGKVEKRRTQLEESVARYLAQLDTADRQEPSESIELKKTHLKEKLEKLKSEMQKLEAIEKRVLASPDNQISLTDPDSRSMATSGRGSGVVGYNVQIAVDTEHHLIVHHAVTNVGSDRSQLASTATAAKEVLGLDMLEAVADRGYFNGEEIKACDDAGITVTLPKPMTSRAKSEGRFGKQDFVYLAEENAYRCLAGEKLTCRYTNEENGQRLHRYWPNACRICPLKAKCTEGNERRITRWEHEAVVEAVQARLDANPGAMRTRRETVEHPFGTIKMRMGATHFLCAIKQACEFKSYANETAKALAPYVHARIGEVPVKSDGDAEYVIVVPPVVHGSDAWARMVNAKLIDAQPIDAKTNGNGSNGHG